MSSFRQLLKWINVVGFIRLVGAIVLLVAFGPLAFVQTDLGRKCRLCAGALVVGVGLGVLFYSFYPDLLSAVVTDPSAKPWVAFLALPILLLGFAFFLESVKRKLG